MRSWRKVGGTPFVVAGGQGAELLDLDGRRYVDFVGSWGPQILGHAHPAIVGALKRQMARGTGFGCPTAEENRLAELVREAFPGMERMRFVSSGTEAVMHALRVARGFTGRDLILKFEGCYHGASDGVLVRAGSGAATLGIPDSAGVPQAIAQLTLTAPFNDLTAVKQILKKHGKRIAAVIVEPVVGNSGVLVPAHDFLPRLMSMTRQAGALVIFDEVMTGFRLAYGGAQEYFGLEADLTILGKIVGGGLPCAAYGGRKEIMDCVAPQGPVYQAGTLSGNPLAMTAGVVTLKELRKKGVYERLERLGTKIENALLDAAAETPWLPRIQFNRVGSMFTVFFSPEPVTDFASAARADGTLYARFFHAMLSGGVYFPPSPFEAAFVNLAFTDRQVQRVSAAAKRAFGGL